MVIASSKFPRTWAPTCSLKWGLIPTKYTENDSSSVMVGSLLFSSWNFAVQPAILLAWRNSLSSHHASSFLVTDSKRAIMHVWNSSRVYGIRFLSGTSKSKALAQVIVASSNFKAAISTHPPQKNGSIGDTVLLALTKPIPLVASIRNTLLGAPISIVEYNQDGSAG